MYSTYRQIEGNCKCWLNDASSTFASFAFLDWKF